MFILNAGQMRVVYGRADDPHRQYGKGWWAADMTHGVDSTNSDTSGERVNPATS